MAAGEKPRAFNLRDLEMEKPSSAGAIKGFLERKAEPEAERDALVSGRP